MGGRKHSLHESPHRRLLVSMLLTGPMGHHLLCCFLKRSFLLHAFTWAGRATLMWRVHSWEDFK